MNYKVCKKSYKKKEPKSTTRDLKKKKERH